MTERTPKARIAREPAPARVVTPDSEGVSKGREARRMFVEGTWPTPPIVEAAIG